MNIFSSRREFIKTVAAAGAIALVDSPLDNLLAHASPEVYTDAASGNSVEANPFERAMRWANLTLVENDPPNFNLDFWLSLFRDAKVDAVVLSAGGYIAYYPTSVPLHYKSRWMKEGDDPFGQLVKGCRALGMTVVARLDTHAVHNDFAVARPEWISRDWQNQPRRHWHTPQAWITCAYGDYAFEYVPQIIEEVLRLHMVDAVFVNRWQGSGMCYCLSCQRLFKQASGLELPRYQPRGNAEAPDVDWSLPKDNPASAAYAAWRRERFLKIWDAWDATVMKTNPQARFIPNMGSGVRETIEMSEFGRRAIYLTVDRQGRLNNPLWEMGMWAKEYRAVLGMKPLGAGLAFGPQGSYRWKDGVHGRDGESLMWTIEAIANGVRPSIGKTNAQIEDTRWIDETKRLFRWHHANEKYLRNTANLARVALVFTQQTGEHQAAQMGAYQALIEARTPFEMVHENLLDEKDVQAFKLLILPNIAALSKRQCTQLTSFVERGGSLIATYETSLHDENNNRRTDFGLSELFGVSYAKHEAPLVNSFMRLERKTHAAKEQHLMLEGFDGANQIVNTTHRLAVTPRIEFPAPPLTLIPPYPSLPMEELYPRAPKTDVPMIFMRVYGKGRVIYFPGNLDTTIWQFLIEDHTRLFRNAVRWALPEPARVTVEGRGMFDITFWQQRDSLTVHLVNLNNPMTMRGFYREQLPAPPQIVRIRLPDNLQARQIKLLVSDTRPRVERQGESVLIEIPPMLAHEVIAIDL